MRYRSILLLSAVLLFTFQPVPRGNAACTLPGCEGPDINGDCLINLSDLAIVLANFGRSPVPAFQGDTDGDGDVDLTDLARVLGTFGRDCGPPTDPNAPDPNVPGPNAPGPNHPDPNVPGPNVPGPNVPGPNVPGPNVPGPNVPGPNTPGPNTPDPNGPNRPPECTADMTAHRPQHDAGYAPFAKTAVPDNQEESATLGPGIRINNPGDTDNNTEDDLIEVKLVIAPAGAQVALRRSNGNLKVWTTRDKQNGTEIPFTNNKTGALPFGPNQTELTVWVEWVVAVQGTADLHVEPLNQAAPKDTLKFHTFKSIVLALGGEGQVPTDPANANHGTFNVAVTLYRQGYDVHMHDEDDVGANGAGVVYDEIVTAVQTRKVDEVAIFGYSHGGGSTFDLSERLDNNRAAIGNFTITFTSYADGVENDSDVDVQQELRRPPGTGFHLNHYQQGTFGDGFLDGGPVPNSNPAPTGLDVETTVWGAGATHFTVDDFAQVTGAIRANLTARTTR